MHFICILYAFYMLFICILYALYMLFICILYAFYMHFICILYAFYMHFTCILYAFYMHFICILYAFYMHFICFLYAFYMHFPKNLTIFDFLLPFADRASHYLSQYLTNLIHKICFTVGFISCLHMFRAHVLIIRRSKLHYTASGIITPIGGRPVHRLREDCPSQPVHETATCRCDDTRGCVILLMMSTCARNMWRHEIKPTVKQILCIKFVKY